PSREDGPFGSWIFTWRSKENFTSEEVRSLPLANFMPSLSLTSYFVGSVKSADSAIAGLSSAGPGVEARVRGHDCCPASGGAVSSADSAIEGLGSAVPGL